MRYICFRLVVVVIAYKVFNGVFRKELLELGAKLGRQRFVVGEHKSRPLQLLDHLGHCIGLARTGHTEQSLLLQPQFNTLCQLLNSLRLVTGR